MKTKMLLLANVAALVLTLLCYVWVMQLALEVGTQVLDYLDAVMEIAQLS
jgi:DNA-binding transcriptional regulator of glucitol operon